ncbi:MAG: 30S ribosomal protein S16 [Magnetococcales bacterium]|nr:30S ribosomal protein S16 [Magnetococcales bacterium]
MSVRIRLQRRGSKKRPFYAIVAADKRRARDGKFLEKLGTYDPRVKPVSDAMNVNRERFDHWISVGATASTTVDGLIKKYDAETPADAS